MSQPKSQRDGETSTTREPVRQPVSKSVSEIANEITCAGKQRQLVQQLTKRELRIAKAGKAEFVQGLLEALPHDQLEFDDVLSSLRQAADLLLQTSPSRLAANQEREDRLAEEVLTDSSPRPVFF